MWRTTSNRNGGNGAAGTDAAIFINWWQVTR